MRFSKKLKAEIEKIKDVKELTNKLVEIYTHSTSLDHYIRLFDCDIKFIVQTLKQEGAFEHKYCSKCKKLKPFKDFYNNPSMVRSTNRCGVSCQCVSEHGKQYFQDNKQKKYDYGDEYRKTDRFKNYKPKYDKTYKSRADIMERESARANV